MRRCTRAVGAVLAALVCLAGAWQGRAAETVEQQYAFAGQGGLRLPVPAGWQGDLRRSSAEFLPAIVFRPKAGAPFRVVVTPVWVADRDVPGPDRRALGLLVQQAAAQVQSCTGAPTIAVREFQGVTGEGYYFSATGRHLRVDGYTHLTQGLLPVGNFTVAFTIYTTADLPEIVADALTMLKSAVHFPGDS
jgi:hypothetical protein